MIKKILIIAILSITSQTGLAVDAQESNQTCTVAECGHTYDSPSSLAYHQRMHTQIPSMTGKQTIDAFMNTASLLFIGTVVATLKK